MDVGETSRGDVGLQLSSLNDERGEVDSSLLQDYVDCGLSGSILHVDPELDSQISVKGKGLVVFLNIKVFSTLHFILDIHGQIESIVLLEAGEEEVQRSSIELDGERLWDICALRPEVDLVYAQVGGEDRVDNVV